MVSNNSTNMNSSSLQRARRHLSFVFDGDLEECSSQTQFLIENIVSCAFINRTKSCNFFVFTVNYLKIIFCYMPNTTISLSHILLILISCVLFFFYFGLIYVITKFFYIPNLLTLLHRVPISDYAFGFVCHSVSFFAPDILGTLFTCPFTHNYIVSIEFVHHLGVCFAFFSVGISVLCRHKYVTEGLEFWMNMTILLIGYVTLVETIKTKMNHEQNLELVQHMKFDLNNRAILYLSFIIIYCFIIVVASYVRRRRRRRNAETLSNVIVDQPETVAASANVFEMSALSGGSSESAEPAQVEETTLSGCQLWLQAINCRLHMRQQHKVCVCLSIPFFFLIAIAVPVIDEARPLHGWCKYVVCTGIALYALIFVPFNSTSPVFVGLSVYGLIISLLVCIFTRAQQLPNYLIIYACWGVLLSSTLLRYCTLELKSLAWQVLSFKYNWQSDFTAMLAFNWGIVFSFWIIVRCLFQRGHGDAAFGAILGGLIFSIYLILPRLVLHSCEFSTTYVMVSATSETAYVFTVVIIVLTTFGISISGYEFRPTFIGFIWLIGGTYYIFQIMSLSEIVHPFGTQHMIAKLQEHQFNWA